MSVGSVGNELLTINAGVLDGITGFFGAWAYEALAAILLVVVGMITKKYIIPLLKTMHARQTAEYILILADDITDYFAEKYPNAHWSNWLDRAVDKIINVTGIGEGPAERAVRASIGRKKDRISAKTAKIDAK